METTPAGRGIPSHRGQLQESMLMQFDGELEGCQPRRDEESHHEIITDWQRKYLLVSRKEKLWDVRSIRVIGPQDGNPVLHI